MRSAVASKIFLFFKVISLCYLRFITVMVARSKPHCLFSIYRARAVYEQTASGL